MSHLESKKYLKDIEEEKTPNVGKYFNISPLSEVE